MRVGRSDPSQILLVSCRWLVEFRIISTSTNTHCYYHYCYSYYYYYYYCYYYYYYYYFIHITGDVSFANITPGLSLGLLIVMLRNVMLVYCACWGAKHCDVGTRWNRGHLSIEHEAHIIYYVLKQFI